MDTSDQKKKDQTPLLKKCPECSTYLPLDAKKCTSCNKRVGPVDKHGLAKRPVDWMAYIRCLMLWVLLGAYIWWAFFFKKQ